MIKEYHCKVPYRELAANKYVEWLGIRGVYHTTIQKAIARLPEELLKEAAGPFPNSSVLKTWMKSLMDTGKKFCQTDKMECK